MNTHRVSFLIVAAVILLGSATFVSASSPFDIEFPIPELGGCADKTECRAYCDDAAHGSECLAFARKHGLVDESTAIKAEKAIAGGPGGCKGEEQCRSYCEDTAHEDECIEFAVANGFMSKEEAARIRKPGPGGCRGKACQTYCEDPAHENECFDFAVKNGFIGKEEAVKIRKFKDQFEKGGPGGCRAESECRAYCEDPAHVEECLAFGEEHGVIAKEDAVRVRKAGLAGGPGGCKGQEQCRNYCEDTAHQLECIEFAEKNGFMNKEEATRAKKFAGKTGPGGCRGEQCRVFCESPDNSEACLEHAEREGLLPPEEVARARKFMQASRAGGPGGCRGVQCRDYCGDPAHQEECFSFAKKQGLIRPEEEKQFEVGRKIQEKVKETGGPGGCRTDEECRSYCADAAHVEECVAFGATHGGIPPEQVRQMLKDFTEHRFEGRPEFGPPEDFRRFEEGSRKRFEEFRQLEEHFREGPGGPGGFPGGFPGGPPAGGFPGRPGEFPGGGPGAGGFVGPGGCTSPAECIKYCTEHKEDCFSFGPPGVPGARPPEGGIPPGHEFPRLRGGISQEIPREVHGDFEQCLTEILGPEEVRRVEIETNQGAFFARKSEAVKTCTERLRGAGGGAHEDFFDRIHEFVRPPGSEGESRRGQQCQIDPCANWPAGQECLIKAPVIEVDCRDPRCNSGPCITRRQERERESRGRLDDHPFDIQELQRLQQDAAAGRLDREGLEKLRALQSVPRREGQFPGRAPEGFPGKPGEFPGRPEGFPPSESVRPPEPHPTGEFRPPEGFVRPPSETSSVPPSGTSGQFPTPPAGEFHPPEGSFSPPPQGSFPSPTGSFEQPPSSSTPPPEFHPPPSSAAPRKGFFASIIDLLSGKR